MEITINEEKFVYAIEDDKSFKKSIYYAPLVSYMKEVSFTVKGEDLSVSIYLDSSRVSVYKKSLWKFKNKGNYANVTYDLIKTALNVAIADTATINGTYMKNKEVYKKVQIITNNKAHIGAIEKSMETILRVKDIKLLNDLMHEEPSKINEFRTYLYYCIGGISFKHNSASFDTMSKVKETLAYSLLNIMRDERYDLETIDGNMGYVAYLCEAMGYCSATATTIAKESRVLMKVLEAMLKDNELEEFIKEYVSDEELEDIFESYEVSSVQELYTNWLNQ